MKGLAARATRGAASVLLFVLCVAGLSRLGTAAPETVSVTLPGSISFGVTNISASTAGTGTKRASFSGAALKPNRAVNFSVKADGDFVPPGGVAIPAARISWTTSNVTNGVGSNGTLSNTVYTQLFLGNDNAVAGGVDVTWTLAPLGVVPRAGAHNLTLRWKIEALH